MPGYLGHGYLAGRARLQKIAIAVALTTASLLLLAACGGESQTEIERNLAAELERHIAPAVIADVDCPDEAPLTSGSEFLCDATVEGQYYEAQVNIIDAQGRFEVQRRHAVLNVIRTEASLSADASLELGLNIRADCSDSEYLVVLVGKKVTCILTDTDSQRTQEIRVTVTSEDAAFDWALN